MRCYTQAMVALPASALRWGRPVLAAFMCASGAVWGLLGLWVSVKATPSGCRYRTVRTATQLVTRARALPEQPRVPLNDRRYCTGQRTLGRGTFAIEAYEAVASSAVNRFRADLT
jgi:hypothetical protein